MRHLVIGHKGQIGEAIFRVLSEGGLLVDGKDIGPTEKMWAAYEYIHVCIRHSEDFAATVRKYAEDYLAPGGLVIVHSTVPVGTCDALSAVHSPVRGIHPDLFLGVKTFVKYFGGKRCEEAAKVFSDIGIETRVTPLAANTESLKIWDTTQYGWNIVLEKVIYAWCQEKGLDFDLIYTDANRTYNAYNRLGHPEYAKYVLKHHPGPIGGHCVIQNCDLLDNWIPKLIKQMNDEVFAEETVP